MIGYIDVPENITSYQTQQNIGQLRLTEASKKDLEICSKRLGLSQGNTIAQALHLLETCLHLGVTGVRLVMVDGSECVINPGRLK